MELQRGGSVIVPDSTLVEEGFVRREHPRHHTIHLPKRENVLYSRNNSIFVSFVTPGRQRAQVLVQLNSVFQVVARNDRVVP